MKQTNDSSFVEIVQDNGEKQKALKQYSYSIEDKGAIFSILRNKMYSNPIESICREILCNARDANREVGNEQVPIEIHIPTNTNLSLKIKDSGPGISPSRMENIFINYSSSTKRDDNTQTGGFGLGAKTPFSYTDSFSIITVVDKKKYSYIAYIDETSVGKIDLQSEEDCNEPNGTEIVIPVTKREDFNKFYSGIITCVKHWDVKPIFKQSSLNIPQDEVLMSSDDKTWNIIKNKSYYSNDKSIDIVVDGIGYTLSLYQISNSYIKSFISYTNNKLVFYFKTGEINFAATRESFNFDEKFVESVTNRINKFYNDYKTKLQEQVANQISLKDAHLLFKTWMNDFESSSDFRSDLISKGGILWNNIDVATICQKINLLYLCDVYEKSSTGRTSVKDKYPFSFEGNPVVYLSDKLQSLTPAQYNKLFTLNLTSGARKICILQEKNVDEEVLFKHELKKQLEAINIALLFSGKKRVISQSKTTIFKFDDSSFGRTSLGEFLENKSNKVLVRISEEKEKYNQAYNIIFNESLSNQPLFSKKGNGTEHDLRNIVKFLDGYTFYAIKDNKYDEFLSSYDDECVTFESVITEFFTKDFVSEEMYNKLLFINSRHNAYIGYNEIEKIKFINTSSNGKNAILSKILENIKEKDDFVSTNSDWFSIHTSFFKFNVDDVDGNDPFDIFPLIGKFYKKYPMLELIGLPSYNSDKTEIAKRINDYIDIVDLVNMLNQNNS